MHPHEPQFHKHNFFLSLLLAGVLVLTLTPVHAASLKPQEQRTPAQMQPYITREVYHQLILMPHYSVFDFITFKVVGNNLSLSGYVTQPFKKSDAESAVKGVEGVGSINNQIQVLPISPMDDQLRRAEFRSIYSFSSLQKYAQSAVQSIHIIVQNGHVTLEGTVDSQGDKDAAGIRAKTVPNVFSVTNNLQVQQETKH